MKRITLASSLLFALLCAASAQAQDVKAYSGVGCLSEDDTADIFLRGQAGRIENVDAAMTGHVFCPIVRDVGAPMNGTVVVVDQHPNLNVQCRLTSRLPDGTIFAFNQQTSAGNNAAPQVLTFPMVPGPVPGHYTLRCTLPPLNGGNASSVISYTMSE